MTEYFTVAQVAAICDVHVISILRDVEAGVLIPSAKRAGGGATFDRRTVRSYALDVHRIVEARAASIIENLNKECLL